MFAFASRFAAGLSLTLGVCAAAAGQTALPATEPSAQLLQRLNAETQTLYQNVHGGIVRVQLPTPKYLADLAAGAGDNPANKWPGLNREVLNALNNAPQVPRANISPIVVPSTQSSPGDLVIQPGVGQPNVITIHAPAQGGVALRISLQPAGTFAPNNIGLVLDERGYILVPMYIERQTVPATGVPVMVGDDPLSTAHFVASDDKARLTILQLDQPQGKSIKTGAAHVPDGSFVLLLAPNSGSGRWIVWTGGEHEYGVVVSIDGCICGFINNGQFLSLASATPAIEDLIKYGKVRRAVLGVGVQEIVHADELRQQFPALGNLPALRITDVAADSAAAKAGLLPGDIILAVADQPVGAPVNFAAVISARSGKTTMSILRDGQPHSITVDLLP